MGLFSRKPKENPKVIVQGIELAFHQEYEGWAFIYRGTEFVSFQPALHFPSLLELDSILQIVESLMPEMKTRLQKGELEVDDGESYIINIDGFQAEKSFEVCWSEGKSWGDMGVDFTIKDSAIIDEAWGD